MDEIIQYIVSILVGLATAIPLVIKLIQYVKQATQEKNWGNLLGLLLDLIEQAEKMFDTGATRKEWVMAMAQTSAEYVAYPLDSTALSNLIDSLVSMSRNVNAEALSSGNTVTVTSGVEVGQP